MTTDLLRPTKRVMLSEVPEVTLFFWIIKILAKLLILGWALGTRFPRIGDYLDVAVVTIVVLSLIPLGIEYLRHRRARSRADTFE